MIHTRAEPMAEMDEWTVQMIKVCRRRIVATIDAFFMAIENDNCPLGLATVYDLSMMMGDSPSMLTHILRQVWPEELPALISLVKSEQLDLIPILREAVSYGYPTLMEDVAKLEELQAERDARISPA